MFEDSIWFRPPLGPGYIGKSYAINEVKGGEGRITGNEWGKQKSYREGKMFDYWESSNVTSLRECQAETGGEGGS